MFGFWQIFVFGICSHPPRLYKVAKTHRMREIMVFIGKPKGRSRMISNATNPLKESRKESLLRCVGCLIFIGHFPQMSPMIRGSFAKNDMQIKASCGSSPPAIHRCLDLICVSFLFWKVVLVGFIFWVKCKEIQTPGEREGGSGSRHFFGGVTCLVSTITTTLSPGVWIWNHVSHQTTIMI